MSIAAIEKADSAFCRRDPDALALALCEVHPQYSFPDFLRTRFLSYANFLMDAPRGCEATALHWVRTRIAVNDIHRETGVEFLIKNGDKHPQACGAAESFRAAAVFACSPDQKERACVRLIPTAMKIKDVLQKVGFLSLVLGSHDITEPVRAAAAEAAMRISYTCPEQRADILERIEALVPLPPDKKERRGGQRIVNQFMPRN